MKFDSVIIGGGLAGLVCGIRLSKAGRRCAIISSGQSALHFSSGSFDLLGALPDGTPVTAPAESVAETIRQAPEHPYARIGAERFGALAAEAAALLAEAGVAVEGDAARNHYRLTPMGGLKPAWLTLAGYVRSEASDALPWRKVVLFNAEGFLDFYTQFLAEGFRRMGTECAVRTFNMPALETIRNNPSEMRSANIARIFDRQENLDELARILRREAGDAEAVLLPAVLGIDRRDAAAQLERQAGRPVAMVATLPPSVPGLQAQLQLRRYFQQSGGVYMLGDTAVRYEAEGGRITALDTADHGDIAFEADSYVLATGSYFSQGLVAGMDGVREPLFGLDVACAADRGAWYDRDLFAAQPFELFGVKCDERLRGLRDGRAVENLYAIGAGLAGFNPVKEGCGAGVSMLTALAAAERILNE